MGGARFFFGFNFFADALFKKDIAEISREQYVSSWDVNIVIAIKIRYFVQPYCVCGESNPEPFSWQPNCFSNHLFVHPYIQISIL